MELLKDIASVAGKPGLFKILKPTRTGVILETIDDKKSKVVANSNERVSILKEISVYTTTSESSISLDEVLNSIHKAFGKALPVTVKSTDAELRAFMEKVLPEYDEERVYCSDIKKLVGWYGILSDKFPEIFVTEKSEAKKEEKVKTEESSEEGEKKPKAKAKAKATVEEKEEEKPKKTKAKKAE